MTEAQLYELIAKLETRQAAKNSDESISRQAHRDAERISDSSVFPILQHIIEDNPQPKNKSIRKGGYYILGSILRNVFNKNACLFLIQQLNLETDKYIIADILDRLAGVTLPEEIDITPIVRCSQSDKWQIRHNAIITLGSSATQTSKDALAFYLNQEDEVKYKYEIIYSIASMAKIGTTSDIPLLEHHIHSRIRDISGSAELAIEQIKQN